MGAAGERGDTESFAKTRFAGAIGKPLKFVEERLSRADSAILFYEFNTGRAGVRRFCQRVNETLESGLPEALISEIWCSIFTSDQKMFALVRFLAQKYRTFLLSDTDPLHWEFLNKKYGIEAIFTGTILSFKRGAIKTDPDVFKLIAANYRFTPEKTLFVDDMEKNINAAAATGYKTIRHESYEKTAGLLAERGIGLE